MASTLPSEILFMVFDNLGDERDYNSLYQCALASKTFTEHALAVLYRIYDASPLRGGGTEDEQLRSQAQPQIYSRRPLRASRRSKEEQSSPLRKWITLWRSIILSTLDLTYLPYYSYIRYLDLDDLGNLLGSGGTVKDELYTPELQEFVSRGYVSEGKKRRRSARALPDNEWMKVKIGSTIVQKNPLIRGMSCNVQPSMLNEWIESSPQLQTLTLWSGAALSQQAGKKIREQCPEFKQLRIYFWQNKPPGNAEEEAEELFNTLRPNSLEYLEVLSFSHLGPKSIKALGTQQASLTELKLTRLTIETIRELPSLNVLPKLEVLSLTDSSPTTWNEEFYETLGKVAEWIRSCTKLKRLELRKFMHDGPLLTQALGTDDLHLTSLSFAGYKLSETDGFREALFSHDSLQYLYLRGEESSGPRDNDALITSLSPLYNLRELELKDVSDWFTMDQVQLLTPSLPNLERLWISGETFNDSIWPAFSCLTNLKSLAIYALSNFSADGIMNFISQLGEGNRGLNLSVLNSMSGVNFPEHALDMIREVLAEKVNGTFDFGLAQEEFSDEDSNVSSSD